MWPELLRSRSRLLKDFMPPTSLLFRSRFGGQSHGRWTSPLAVFQEVFFKKDVTPAGTTRKTGTGSSSNSPATATMGVLSDLVSTVHEAWFPQMVQTDTSEFSCIMIPGYWQHTTTRIWLPTCLWQTQSQQQ